MLLVSSPEDAHLKLLVDTLAQRVADDGPGVEEMAKLEYQSIPAYRLGLIFEKRYRKEIKRKNSFLCV